MAIIVDFDQWVYYIEKGINNIAHSSLYLNTLAFCKSNDSSTNWKVHF